MINSNGSEQTSQDMQNERNALHALCLRLANEDLHSFNQKQHAIRLKQQEQQRLAFIAHQNQIRTLEELLAALTHAAHNQVSTQPILARLDANQQNEYGQTILEQALLQQRFQAAQFLLDNGAEFGPKQREALAFTLDTNTDITNDFSSALINIPARPQTLHPMKEFGLTLGIVATGQDGTYSQYAHLGPTLRLLTDEITQYAQSLPQSAEQAHYQALAQAHQFADQSCEFQYSKASPQAGHRLAERFQSGQITTIPTGCIGHAMAVTLVDNYLVFTNRGEGGTPPTGTSIFELKDKSAITPEFINTLVNGINEGTPHQKIMQMIHDVVKQPAIRKINSKSQKYDNCTIANPRSNMLGVLTVLHAKENKDFSLKSTSKEVPTAVKNEYKAFTASMRDNKLNQLINKLPDPDAVTLAQAYVKQHKRHTKDRSRVARVSDALATLHQLDARKIFAPQQSYQPNAMVAGSKRALTSKESHSQKRNKIQK